MKKQVAVLGTGSMGAPMAANLARIRPPLTVWNRTRAKAEALAPLGATVAPDIASAVAEADVVITMLQDGAAVTEVLAAAETAMKSGAVLVDMSSIPPDLAREHAARLAARGLGHLDAPVSGGTQGAEAGTLSIMVGGPEETYERVRTILTVLGRPTHVGPAGAGQVAKLANQVIVTVTLGAVSEALLLAAAAGADPAAVREALLGGTADSRILTLHGQRMLERNFLPGGLARNQLKDIDTAMTEAKAAGLTLPFAELAQTLYRSLVAIRGGELDHAGLLLELERLNPGKRVGDRQDRLPGAASSNLFEGASLDL